MRELVAAASHLDPTLRLALLVGSSALLLSLVSLAYLFALRLMLIRRQRRLRAIARKWRPQLLAVTVGEPFAGPRRVPVGERQEVVHLWNKLQASLRGDVKDRLNSAFRQMSLEADCRRWLRARNPWRRLLAIVALGHLADPGDWPRLRPLLDAPHPYISISALRALMRIAPMRAASDALALLEHRSDWPRGTLLVAFQEAGIDQVTQPLADWLASANDEALIRGMPLLQTGDLTRLETPLLRLLRRERPVDVIAGALKLVESPHALPQIRGLCTHPAWEVRTQAAAALGRMRQAEDRYLLRALLADRNWWVRYRAAEALLRLPDSGAAVVYDEFSRLDDRYARDILRQAAAEQGLPMEALP